MTKVNNVKIKICLLFIKRKILIKYENIIKVLKYKFETKSVTKLANSEIFLKILFVYNNIYIVAFLAKKYPIEYIC